MGDMSSTSGSPPALNDSRVGSPYSGLPSSLLEATGGQGVGVAPSLSSLAVSTTNPPQPQTDSIAAAAATTTTSTTTTTAAMSTPTPPSITAASNTTPTTNNTNSAAANSLPNGEQQLYPSSNLLNDGKCFCDICLRKSPLCCWFILDLVFASPQCRNLIHASSIRCARKYTPVLVLLLLWSSSHLPGRICMVFVYVFVCTATYKLAWRPQTNERRNQREQFRF